QPDARGDVSARMAFHDEQRTLRQAARAANLERVVRGESRNRHVGLEPSPTAVRRVAEVNSRTDRPAVCRRVERTAGFVLAERCSYEQVEARESLRHEAGERLASHGRSTEDVYLPE